jgi:hypothetical protein
MDALKIKGFNSDLDFYELFRLKRNIEIEKANPSGVSFNNIVNRNF